MWQGKKKLRILIRFHSANKINNYSRGGGEGKKKKKIQKNLQSESNLKIIHVFLESFLSVLSLAGSHGPPHLPRMPSKTVLISGSDLGAAQCLIWSYSYVFLPPIFTAIRTSVLSFVGALNVLLYIPIDTESA